MTCDADVCGTGGFTGPKPGDPDNNSTLSAVAVFGGIEVSWSYPTTNPAAVAHTLVFRGNSPDFTAAIQRSVAAGNTYYDKITSEATFYYWIQIVSVNGTIGAAIGPVWATSKILAEDLITQLTGQIDSGMLSTALKGDLNQLSLLNANLADEIFDREGADTSFAQALLDVQDGIADAHTYITNEITSRVTENSALAESINLLAVTLGGNIAAVQTSSAAWVTTSTNRMNEFDTQFTTANGKLSAIGALYTTKLTVNGLVGGFGVYNDGSTVEAGFDVDTFWVGKTNANKRKPFIISGGQTYIDQAVINQLTFANIKNENGTIIGDATGKIKAELLDTKGLVIRDSAGNPVFSAGTGLSSSLVTGLGSLATQNSVPYSSVTGTKPPTNADNTATNVAAGITGQGTLATANNVVVGSTVKFPDGSTMSTVDFVNRLSRIGTGNISTFMESAAIGNAYIGNLAVNTIKIANNAVTIPIAAYGAGTVSAGSGWTNIIDAWIDPLGAPMHIQVSCYCVDGYVVGGGDATYTDAIKTEFRLTRWTGSGSPVEITKSLQGNFMYFDNITYSGGLNYVLQARTYAGYGATVYPSISNRGILILAVRK